MKIIVYGLRSEKRSEDVSDEATNAMDSKDIEGIIAAEEILELRRVVASNTTTHTENNSSPGRDISRTRGDADKTSDNT